MTEEDPFETFWKLCPRKVQKPLARAKWSAIVSDEGLATRILDRDSGMYVPSHHRATPHELIEAMKSYRRWVVRNSIERQYILHPATWLNRGGWEDDYDEDQRKPYQGL